MFWGKTSMNFTCIPKIRELALFLEKLQHIISEKMTKSESQNLYIWFSKVVTAKLHAVFTVIPARKYLVYVVNKICEIYFGLSYGISVLSSLQCQFQTTKICLKKCPLQNMPPIIVLIQCNPTNNLHVQCSRHEWTPCQKSNFWI